MILGLRTVIYRVPELAAAKVSDRNAFEVAPYFDEPYYVGFNIAGYELGLDPDPTVGAAGTGLAVAYWGVDALERTLDRFKSLGAVVMSGLQEVGDGIKVATIADPYGNLIGLIENPHFKLSS